MVDRESELLSRQLIDLVRQAEAEGKWVTDDELSDPLVDAQISQIRARIVQIHTENINEHR